MIYALLGFAAILLLGAAATFAAGYKVGSAGKADAERRAEVAEAKAASAEQRAKAAQPDHVLDVLSLPFDELHDAVWGPPGSPGGSPRLDAAGEPGDMGLHGDDGNDAA